MQHTTSVPSQVAPRSSWRTRIPFFYGWVIVISLFIALIMAYGVYYTFSIFFVAMIEQFGWSRAATSGVFSLFVITIAAGGVMAGTLIDRFGPSRVVPAGGVLLAVGLAATSQLTELWQFYLYFGVVCGFGVSWSGWVPCVTLVNRWFAAKRGIAMGIASAGIGLGTVCMVPFTQQIISSAGWRSAYMVLSGLALLFIVPQSACLMLGRPDEVGQKPDGATDKGSSTVSRAKPAKQMVVVDRQWVSRNWGVASAMRTSRYWYMFAHLFLSVLTNQMLWVHQAAYLVDGGFDKMLAASVVGLAGFISMPAKIMWGWAADRFGREVAFSMGVATMVSAIVMLVLTRTFPSVWLVFGFCAAFSIGYAITAPISPTAVADIFGGPNFGSIFGVLNVSTGLGAALGAWFAGYIFDVSGSYVVAFAIAAACSIGSAISIWLASPRNVRRVPARGVASGNR
ncbi:MAG TPA: MFS transporter [Chloroflexota bacterium]|nr:MFS transporter [Chloroflexota bacterium]